MIKLFWLNLEEQKLIDIIVDGIPYFQLRMQGVMQNFQDKQKLQVFSKIELKKKAETSDLMTRV